MYFDVAFIAFFIDKIFGEFTFVRHPVVLMGDFIKWFEKRFYKDTFLRGITLTCSLLFVVWFFVYIVCLIDNVFIQAIIGSTTIASKMLYESVKEALNRPENLKYLVSRDTKNLTKSETNKALIETYAENLSDGVVAPVFYMVLFGLEGAFLYKAVNTLDSMVGYKTKRYKNFGKFSARLDDVLNYIPARITACFIMLATFTCRSFRHYAKKHESPNAGYPISAMAVALNLKLGGDTFYFGKLKKKPFFGDGKEIIAEDDVKKALLLHVRFEMIIGFVLFIGIFL